MEGESASFPLEAWDEIDHSTQDGFPVGWGGFCVRLMLLVFLMQLGSGTPGSPCAM